MDALDHYDVIIIGSGFGGSVSAMRLTEKGYTVGVFEAGRRFADADFPKNSADIKNFLWAPKLGFKGIQRIHILKDVVVLAGAGVGGGSLNYANTLYRPKSDAFYHDKQWAHITNWATELAPYYDQAERMLGVITNPTMTSSDIALKRVAEKMNVGNTFSMARVGVFFGEQGKQQPGIEVDDPFFGGVGPRRSGCLENGECMTGCRHNAKNTLPKNYLYLAEKTGAIVHPETTVVRVNYIGPNAYVVDTEHTAAMKRNRTRKRFTADHVIVAAGTYGTQSLLHQMKAEGTLPNISRVLGSLTRTNSEALCGAATTMRNRKRYDFTKGVAITSSIHPDSDTHIEPVRYGKGIQSMGLLSTVMTDGGGRFPRWMHWIGEIVKHPGQALSVYAGLGNWSRRTIIGLTMQSSDNSITVTPKIKRSGRIKLTSHQGHGTPNPTWLPIANEAMRHLAKDIGGKPYNTLGEVLNIPMTAHFLGGCPIGDTPETGVIDPYHRLYGYEGMHVVDGSAISANLGVNPSLTISAQAERAMAMWPNKGESDARPPMGAPYEQVHPIAPNNPIVPLHAPAALRFTSNG